MKIHRILVVGATGSLASTPAEDLRAAGYAVVQTDPDSALDILAAGTRIDVFVECRPAGLDGSLLRELRRCHGTIPAIVVLDDETTDQCPAALREGAVRVLMRHPRFAANLRVAIAEVLEETITESELGSDLPSATRQHELHAGNLPAADGRASPDVGTPRHPADATGGARILLVEDSEQVRRLSQTALSRAGYAVTVAAAAEEALEIAAGSDTRFDLLITDVVLPGLSGPDLVDRLERDDRCAAVMFVSGYARELVVSRRGTGPGRRFLAKPFSLNELQATVADALRDVAARSGAGPGGGHRQPVRKNLTGCR